MGAKSGKKYNTETSDIEIEIEVANGKGMFQHYGMLSDSKRLIKCQDCRDTPTRSRANKRALVSASEPKAIWLCLECGHLSCAIAARTLSQKSHAGRHAMQYGHQQAIRLENPQLLCCYSCDRIIHTEKSDDGAEQMDVETFEGKKPGNSEVVVSDGKGKYLPRGLKNLGKTCYFNAVLQCLLALSWRGNYFDNLDGSNGPITAALKELLEKIKKRSSSREVINPRTLFDCVRKEYPESFPVRKQHDSHELLSSLLTGLANEEKRSAREKKPSKEDGNSDSTFVDTLFMVEYSSAVTCLNCNYCSLKSDQLHGCTLYIPEKHPLSEEKGNTSEENKVVEAGNTGEEVSVDRCLSLYTKVEFLSKENKNAWLCAMCSNVPQEERMGQQKNLQTPGSDELIDKGVNICAADLSPVLKKRKKDGLNPVASTKEDIECGGDLAPARLPYSSGGNITCCKMDKGCKNFDVPHDGPNFDRCTNGIVEGGEFQTVIGSSDKGTKIDEKKAENKRVPSDCTKRILIHRIPPILVIHLSRSRKDAEGKLVKLHDHVKFEDTIDLEPYMDDARCLDKYHLVAVVEHVGEKVVDGHYVAYVRGEKKDPRRSEDENGNYVWYSTSDAIVNEVSWSKVLQSMAYILFYARN